MFGFRRVILISTALAAPLAATHSGAASMIGQTISGVSEDPRIHQCGIRIDGDRVAELVPFIEAAADFNGSFDLSITKRSEAGSSQSRQSNRITAGMIGASRVRLNLPARIEILMNVMDEAGKAVCHVRDSVDLPAPTTKL